MFAVFEQFVSLFSGQDASALANMFQIVGIGGLIGGAVGVFQLIKRAKGRKPTTVTIEHTERVKVTFEGDEPLEVDKRVWLLFNNSRARKAIEQVMRPLRKQGITDFKIRHKDKPTFEAKQDEVAYFDAPTEHEGETVSSNDTRLMIVAPSFQEGNKWRVTDGSRNMFVSIQDPTFVHAVQQGSEAFRKGDFLHVTLETRQWVEGADLKAEHSIVKVHRHESGPTQQKLFSPETGQE